MNVLIRPMKGIIKPMDYRYQLKKAETFGQYRLHIILLFITSICLYAISAIFGIGTESLSQELASVNKEVFEAEKQLFLVGSILAGLVTPCVFLFLSSLYYWSFVQIDFQRLMIIQMTIFVLFLLEKVIEIPLYLLLDISAISNIFSLGVIAQYITEKEFVIHLLSQITLFRVGMLVYSFYYLKDLMELSRKALLFVIGFLFTFYWLGSGVLSYIDIGIFFSL